MGLCIWCDIRQSATREGHAVRLWTMWAEQNNTRKHQCKTSICTYTPTNLVAGSGRCFVVANCQRWHSKSFSSQATERLPLSTANVELRRLVDEPVRYCLKFAKDIVCYNRMKAVRRSRNGPVKEWFIVPRVHERTVRYP